LKKAKIAWLVIKKQGIKGDRAMENIMILSLIFFCVSTFFSMLGMGGGILYVPFLLFAGYTMKTAPSISLILILAVSTVIGAMIRGKVSINLDGNKLKKGFGIVLIFIAFKFSYTLIA